MIDKPLCHTAEGIAKRLRDACVGHPCAKIPWPHRLLHDAADEIDRLRMALQAIYSHSAGPATLDGARDIAKEALRR